MLIKPMVSVIENVRTSVVVNGTENGIEIEQLLNVVQQLNAVPNGVVVETNQAKTRKVAVDQDHAHGAAHLIAVEGRDQNRARAHDHVQEADQDQDDQDDQDQDQEIGDIEVDVIVHHAHAMIQLQQMYWACLV